MSKKVTKTVKQEPAITDAPYDNEPVRPLYESKPMYKVTAEAIQGLEPIITAEAEYQRLYSWISKGDIDATLKCILKELVMIRMGGGHV